MSQGLTPHQKERVLGLHYSSFTNDTIAADVGIASGRVSAVITEHKKSLVDLINYTEIRQITKSWRNSNITIPDASKIIETNGILQNSGLTIHDLPKISQIVSLCDSKDISLELLVDTSVQISPILDANPDVSLSEIPSHSQKLIDENNTLQKQNAELIQSIKENKQTLEDTLQKNNTTLSHLESFNENQDYLKSVNIPIDSPEKLAVLLKSAKNENYDVSKVIAHLNQKDSIQSQIKQLESKQKHGHLHLFWIILD